MDKKSYALVVAAGKIDRDLQGFIQEADYVVGVDGGLKHLPYADLYVGDGDSYQGNFDKAKEVIHLPVEKDMSDLEYALDLLIERGMTEIMVFGAFGSRWDHFLTTLGLLAQKKANIQLKDAKNHLYLAKGCFLIEPPKEQETYLSFILFEPTNLTIENALYEVDHQRIEPGSSLLVSNGFKKGPVKVQSDKSVMVCLSRD